MFETASDKHARCELRSLPNHFFGMNATWTGGGFGPSSRPLFFFGMKSPWESGGKPLFPTTILLRMKSAWKSGGKPLFLTYSVTF